MSLEQKITFDNDAKERDDGVTVDAVGSEPDVVVYRLYKRRFEGLAGLVLLNVVEGMALSWFGPISNAMVAEFGITLDQTNWLGNIFACIYLPTAFLVPVIVRRYGLRHCCDLGCIALLLSAWIRYAGAAPSLSSRSAYTLLMIGQIFAAIAQPVFQILGPKYSEAFFDLRGRTTATMIVSIANPVGSALGQLLSPIATATRTSILVLGIISTVVVPFVLLISAAPPSPPTYSGSQPPHSLRSLLNAMIGRVPSSHSAYMTSRERLDFAIVATVFGPLVATSTCIAILSAQMFIPYGYSESTSGLMGAVLLLAGLVVSLVVSPLSDRVFTHHLGLTIKIFAPVLALGWFSLIWAIRPNNLGALYAIMAIMGIAGITILPLALELACDLTKNADGSSAILWFFANIMNIIFILVPSALRAGPEASPPLNMHRAFMFTGVFVVITTSLIFGLQGHQPRKAIDREKQNAQQGSPT